MGQTHDLHVKGQAVDHCATTSAHSKFNLKWEKCS